MWRPSVDTFRATLLVFIGLLFITATTAVVTNWIVGQLSVDLGLIDHRLTGHYRLLDGWPSNSSGATRRPWAVIIENHLDAQPIAGLESTSIVYEVIVEGDITRFLALFDPASRSGKIGPVRSVRPFFAELVAEYDAVLFHAGGSHGGLEALKELDLAHVNEISADGIYFWRDPDRDPPHNLYTSANQIERALTAKGFNATATVTPWLFKDGHPVSVDAAEYVDTVTIDFSSNNDYTVRFEYNPATNDYTRYRGGTLDKTEAGIILKSENVVIQHVDFDVIDSYGRLAINLGGGGAAEIYRDGTTIVGTWEKTDGRTRFFDSANAEVRFNRGRTWIALVFD